MLLYHWTPHLINDHFSRAHFRPRAQLQLPYAFTSANNISLKKSL